MKLLQIQLHSGAGGAESVARTLEDAWRGDGHVVRTMALSHVESGHAAQAEGRSSAVRRLSRARSEIRSFRPDIIIAHATLAGMYARLAAVSTGYRRRVLVIGHSASDDYSDPRLLVTEIALSLISPAVWLFVSEEGRKGLSRRPIRGRSTADVIGNPVPAAFGEIERSPNPGEVLMLGRVAPQKDLLTAVDALAATLERRPDVILRIAGTIEDRAYHELVLDRARRHGIEHRVSFLGVRDDVPALLTTAHILLHTAVREAASQTLREAFAAAVPIVASEEATRGVPDVDPHGTFPSGDAHAAADRLVEALDDPGSAARKPCNALTPTSIARTYLAHWSEGQRRRARKSSPNPLS